MRTNELHDTFLEAFHHTPDLLVQAPGRVNILGEHVDYNDGFVLPAAIDRAVFIHAKTTGDDCISLYAKDLGEQVTFRLLELAHKTDIQGKALPGWAEYPAGVAWSLHEAGFEVKGIQAAFTSDVPIGAGLSSSAAIEVGFGVVWQAFGDWQIERLELAKLCQLAENEYVGLACGLMDQFASACGVDGHALFFDTRSLEWDVAPLPDDIALIIADSRIRRSLTHSGYNDRRTACEKAVELLRAYLPGIRSLRDVSPTEFAAYAPFLPEIPAKRAEHVVKEIQRVQSAYKAMLRQDKQALGALISAGHKSLRNLYEVSTPELDTLVEISRKLEGCVGARLTGAGFGGCTINLVEVDQAESFMDGLKEDYFQATGRQSDVFRCRASEGAKVIY